jgi:hypothetical protein
MNTTSAAIVLLASVMGFGATNAQMAPVSLSATGSFAGV